MILLGKHILVLLSNKELFGDRKLSRIPDSTFEGGKRRVRRHLTDADDASNCKINPICSC